MTKRTVAAILFISIASALFSQSATAPEPEPYAKDEFPAWLGDIRRAEIIAFGSLPFVTFLTSIGYDCYRWSAHDYANAYRPWPFKDANNSVAMTDQEQINMLLLSAGICVGVAVFDYGFRAITRMIREGQAEKHNRSIPDPIRITPIVPDAPEVPDVPAGANDGSAGEGKADEVTADDGAASGE